MGEEADTATPDASHVNGIHLLRTMQAHHVSLSMMADQKANILIGLNSVIFALVMRETETMTLPLAVLAATSAVAAVLCMLAVVPAIDWRASGPKLPAPAPNILFFGAFTDMSETEFRDQLDDIMKTDAGIRHAMARDVYQLGYVLKHKKYRYLGWGYRVFVIGMLLSFVTFAVQHLIR